jgi:hypothetical protein
MCGACQVNIIFMAVDHDCDFDDVDYCMGFKANLEVGNMVFTLFFLFEMVVKLLGFGPISYAKEPFNNLDAFIVTTSMLELPAGFEFNACLRHAIEEQLSGKELCQASSGIFLVLRSFRLVRILRIAKLVRIFPQIQKQIKVSAPSALSARSHCPSPHPCPSPYSAPHRPPPQVISKTIGAVSSLVALILIFMTIFAILGMSLLGGKSMDSLDTVDVDLIPMSPPAPLAHAFPLPLTLRCNKRRRKRQHASNFTFTRTPRACAGSAAAHTFA